MLHPIDSLRRISSERDRKAQELQDKINNANDRTHDYKNSTFEERLAAAREEDKLRGRKEKNWITREQFQAYDDEGVDEWRGAEQFRETVEAHRQEMAAYEQAGISEAINQDREAVGIRLTKIYGELDSVDDENDGEIESFEADAPRESRVEAESWNPDVGKSDVRKSVKKEQTKNLDAGKSKVQKISTGMGDSGWEKSYGGNGERKPGKGMIEGIKSWLKMMFGSSEKK